MKHLKCGFSVMAALVLDLDGTVRRTKSGKPFIENLDDIEIMPGVEKIIQRYRDFDYLILGVSNQAAVAHGFKTPDVVKAEIKKTMELFKNHTLFHHIAWCYFDAKGTVEPYNFRSLFRKPDYGILADIERTFYNEWQVIIDWDNSLFVGDRPEDEECAKKAGIPFRHINSFLHEPHTFEIPSAADEEKFNIGDDVEVMDEGLLMLQKFAPAGAKPNNIGKIKEKLPDGDWLIEFSIGDNDPEKHSQVSPYEQSKLKKLKN